MAESFGVAGLGRVHDESGAIRDVLRNHLLQVVGFSPWNLPRSCRRELFVTNISRYSVRSHPLQPTMQFGLSSRDTTMKNGVAAARVAFELVKLQRPDRAAVCSRSLRGRDRQAEPILNKFHSSKWSELHFSWTLPIRAHSNQKCPGA
jgi:hypothetical protein